MVMGLKIQIIDGKETDHSGLVEFCTTCGYQVAIASSGKKGLQCVKREKPDVVLLTFDPPDMSGVEILKKIKKSDDDIVVFSIVSSAELGIGALKLGAEHYFIKPYSIEEIKIVLERWIAIKKFREAVKNSQHQHLERMAQSEFPVGKSMKDVYQQALVLAEEGNVPLLLVGEVGTEKELVARVIHIKSHQFTYPFVSINCKEERGRLLDVQLPKVQRGVEGQKEKAEEGEVCEGGTIFLYHIEDLSKSDQLKVLRYLKSRKGRNSGTRGGVHRGKRIIAATTINIKGLVDKGKFNKELYQKISKRSLTIPPLRKRTNEIVPLAVHLVKRISKDYGKQVVKIDQEVINYLESYEWPGNVSELKNFIEHAVILTSSESIAMKEVEFNVSKKLMTLDALLMNGSFLSLDEIVSLYVNTVIKKVKGNKSKAAKILGVSRNTLKKKSFAL
jgi:DNA-binding NtrC family response regulator